MKNDSQDNLQKQPYISLQKLGENKLVRGITSLVGVFTGIYAAYQISKIINQSHLGEVDAAEVQKNLNNTESIECILSEVDAKDMKEEFWPKWLPKKYRKIIGELPANEVRIEGNYLKFINEPLFPFGYSYQWIKDGNIWEAKLICEGDSGAELTTFVGKKGDLVDIKKIEKIIEAKPINTHAQEIEYKSVPYVTLDSYFRLLCSLPGNFIEIKTTNEDKGNIASLEYGLHGDNFNKYVSPLKERASFIEDKIVISKQGEVFKIEIGKIGIMSTKYTEHFVKYLVGIEKIMDISKENMDMSDSERKAALCKLLTKYQK